MFLTIQATMEEKCKKYESCDYQALIGASAALKLNEATKFACV